MKNLLHHCNKPSNYGICTTKICGRKFIENYQYSNHRVGVHEHIRIIKSYIHEYDNDIPE